MRNLLVAALAALFLTACGGGAHDATRRGDPALYPGETPRIRALINQYADRHDVPRSLVHKVVQRESDYRPGARNGPYYGLMQILPETDVVARTQVVLVIGCSTSDLDT